MSLPITTPSNMVQNNEAHSDGTTSMNNNKEKKKKKKENWMRDNRGALMVVATVIATLTFQIAINPPGGVWQSDTDAKGGCAKNTTCKAGTSVLAFGGSDEQKINYEVFILLCTISFSASLTTILFLMTPLRCRIVIWACIFTMFISVICLAAAYIIAILMVTDPFQNSAVLTSITKNYIKFWGVVFCLMCLVFILLPLFWVVKTCCVCRNAT